MSPLFQNTGNPAIFEKFRKTQKLGLNTSDSSGKLPKHPFRSSHEKYGTYNYDLHDSVGNL